MSQKSRQQWKTSSTGDGQVDQAPVTTQKSEVQISGSPTTFVTDGSSLQLGLVPRLIYLDHM